MLGLKAGRGLGQGVKLWGRKTDSGTYSGGNMEAKTRGSSPIPAASALGGQDRGRALILTLSELPPLLPIHFDLPPSSRKA